MGIRWRGKLRRKKLAEFAAKLEVNLPASEKWFRYLWQKRGFEDPGDRYNKPWCRRIPDLVNHHRRYVIEIDGDYHLRPDQKAKDEKKDRFYKTQAYQVFRIKAYDETEVLRVGKLLEMKEYHKINSVFKRDERGQFIQSQWACPEFEYLSNNQWSWDEKVDGINIRVIWDGERVVFGGKTDAAQIPATLVTKLQELFPAEKFKAVLPDLNQLTLYGEGYGAKIQKGGENYKADGQDFVLFDVKVAEWWLLRDDVRDVALKLGIEAVPIIGSGTLHEAIEFSKKGFKSTWGDFEAEGIVLRPWTPLLTRRGERIITKLKKRDWK